MIETGQDVKVLTGPNAGRVGVLLDMFPKDEPTLFIIDIDGVADTYSRSEFEVHVRTADGEGWRIAFDSKRKQYVAYLKGQDDAVLTGKSYVEVEMEVSRLALETYANNIILMPPPEQKLHAIESHIRQQLIDVDDKLIRVTTAATCGALVLYDVTLTETGPLWDRLTITCLECGQEKTDDSQPGQTA